MPSIFSFFHRKSPNEGRDEEVKAKNKAEGASPQPPHEQPPPAYTSAAPSQPAPTSLPPPTAQQLPTAPRYAPGIGPAAHSQMVAANNMGMLGGAVLGSATGGSAAGGMLEGQVIGNMVMQRVQQEQKHLYYREQAIRYRDGLPADGVGAAGGLAPPLQGGRERSRSRSQTREDRRRKRWERRAKRRDGGGVERNGEPSGSESE